VRHVVPNVTCSGPGVCMRNVRRCRRAVRSRGRRARRAVKNAAATGEVVGAEGGYGGRPGTRRPAAAAEDASGYGGKRGEA
jgi:hypothetical protein